MVSEGKEVGEDFFPSGRVSANERSTPALNEFHVDDYDGKWLQIGQFLSTMALNVTWTKEEAGRIRKKSYRFFLRDGKIMWHPKKRTGTPLRVVTKKEEQTVLLSEFHESPWS